MKIGAHISVRNEIDWIGRVLRYHLDVQCFDYIIVNDDASYDGTSEVVHRYADNDARVIHISTPQKKGFTQDKFSVLATEMLFDKFKCDFVLPLDADEFWYSEKCVSVRKALEYLPKEKSMLVTQAYDFCVTDRDDINENDTTTRQKYCRINNNPKAVFCRANGCISRIAIGNHAHMVRFNPGKEIPAYNLPIKLLSRFHYRIGDKISFLKKVLNQVEGYLVSTNGEWLHEPKNFGGFHIWKHYMRIRQSGLEEAYNRLVFKEEKLQHLLDTKKLIYNDCLSGKIPWPHESIKKVIDLRKI